tara:strand:- start:476 stop:853 length:378 start_codon:yes stop_codon:yes gene_type:complete
MTQISLEKEEMTKDLKIGGVIYPVGFSHPTTIPLNHAITMLHSDGFICTFDDMDKADIARLNNHKFSELIRLCDELKEGDTRSQATKILFPKKAKKAKAKPVKKAKAIATPKKESLTEDIKEVIA